MISLPARERLLLGALPLATTPLVGREREIAAVVGALRSGQIRLLTLIGPGGVGKTRLALRAAAELRSAFADGVAFVSLAAVVEPSQVQATVAQALGVRRGGDRSLGERLVDVLRDRRLLLVLDNFERLLAAGVLVTGLLADCPGLTVLTTSRALLRLSGEHAFPVPPLSLPNPAVALTAASVGEAEAVRLFVARAEAASRGFALSDENAGVVAEICLRLDGLPLAIELAAAKIPLLPPRALLARLDRRLPLLIDGPRDVPDRLRTMRNAIAWSYDLLTPAQQTLARRLAVFVGGFTIEAADSIVGDPSQPALAPAPGPGSSDAAAPPAPMVTTLDGLAALVDHSLVVQVESGGGDAEPRFTLLETIREFGLDRLAAHGEAEALHDRHARFFLAHAEAAGPAFVLHFDEVLGRLEGESANLSAALDWLLRTAQAELALRLGVALWPLWWYRSSYREGLAVLETLLELPVTGPSPARAKLLGGLGTLLHALGDYERAVALQEESVQAWRDLGDRADEAWSLWLLAYTLLGVDVERAEPVVEACLTAYRELDEPWGIGAGIYGLGRIARYRRDNDRAVAFLTESVAIGRQIGYHQGTGSSLETLGQVALDRGDVVAAAEHFAEALSLFLGIRNEIGTAQSLEGLAGVAAAVGDPTRAVRLFAAAAALREAVGSPVLPLDRPALARHRETARAALGETAFSAAWVSGRALPAAEATAEALRFSAAVANAPPQRGVQPGAAGASLSPREQEVLRLIAEGRTDQQIADALSLSRRTVNTHVSRILAKLGARTRAAAAVRGHDLGLLTEGDAPARYT